MKKGFTLLEMLAVIVVISILSLIILPNITEQFADKKEEISKVSQKIILSAAELYANETGNIYQTITINDLVEAGKLEQPIIDQKTGKEISLTKEISIDASGNACIVGIDDCDRITYKQYKNGEIVYFNPVKGKKCTGYIEANSKTGTKSGCMKWYVFNDESESATVNVILDHNTTANVAWNSTGNNSEMKEAADTLKTDTSTWENTARLITANEIAKITGHPTFDASNTGQSWFCLDTNKPDTTNWCSKAQGTSEYAWLFDYTDGCTSYGCDKADSSNPGYLTSTPSKDDSTSAWRVDRLGDLVSLNVADPGYGVRPVITISKFKLS